MQGRTGMCRRLPTEEDSSRFVRWIRFGILAKRFAQKMLTTYTRCNESSRTGKERNHQCLAARRHRVNERLDDHEWSYYCVSQQRRQHRRQLSCQSPRDHPHRRCHRLRDRVRSLSLLIEQLHRCTERSGDKHFINRYDLAFGRRRPNRRQAWRSTARSRDCSDWILLCRLLRLVLL